MLSTDFIDVFAVPGEGSIIDGINPETIERLEATILELIHRLNERGLP